MKTEGARLGHSGVAIAGEGAQDYMNLFVARKMTGNNTPNKVRVAATTAAAVWRGNGTQSLSDFVQSSVVN